MFFRAVAAGTLLACLFGAISADAGESFRSEGAVPSFVLTRAIELPEENGSSGAKGLASQESTELQVRYRTLAAYTTGAAALVLYANKSWWGDGFESKFQTIDEGWFGQDTNHGGADKLGHAFSNYLGTRLFARVFEWAGNDEATALKLSAVLVASTFTVVEVLDGFTDRWKFSKEDAIMNLFGAGLAVVMETSPRLDALVDFRFMYRPGESGRGFHPVSDYTGQTYLMVGKASGVPSLRSHSVLRYVELAVGYGTRGYHLDPSLEGERARNIYYGVSINLAEVLDQTVFRGAVRKSPAQQAANGFLEVFQIPGTVALAHRQLPQ